MFLQIAPISYVLLVQSLQIRSQSFPIWHVKKQNALLMLEVGPLELWYKVLNDINLDNNTIITLFYKPITQLFFPLVVYLKEGGGLLPYKIGTMALVLLCCYYCKCFRNTKRERDGRLQQSSIHPVPCKWTENYIKHFTCVKTWMGTSSPL